ncbi:hypothetical protein SteCoe_27292 [Stentor coeruleus]|uniref:PPM-type phosphatase domain-containing protein n=1 Tax=Stentor coeruleus TaxID=5963 RepID=A0A1R2BBC8_9CILI|nr:hypothetical protein SteCoe_27292 [Stentor coeruleus]
MDRRFPLIKSTPSLPMNSSRMKKYNKDNLIENSPLRLGAANSIKGSRNFSVSPNPAHYQNGPKLPPIINPYEAPAFIPIIHDPLSKLQASRRTISNQISSQEPNNVVIKYYLKFKTGSMMGIPKEQNQDSYIIQSPLFSNKAKHFFAICDGHGTEGHTVSRLIKATITPILEKKLLRFVGIDALKFAIDETCQNVLHGRFDCSFSGSTFVGVLIIGDTLLCANIGDSKAVIGSIINNSCTAVELTKDHKPNRKDEADRIILHGGRIASHDQGGPLRIWFKDQNIPGLAMTRSVGDKASRLIGLISDPEIVERKLISTDKFIVIASDGLWEFVTPRDAVEIVHNSMILGKSEGACERLMREAVIRWNANSASVDDITIIIIFLNAM